MYVVFVSITPTNTVSVNPMIDTAPIGIGCVIQPIMVPTNIANISHASRLNDSGLKGASTAISMPMTRGNINFYI